MWLLIVSPHESANNKWTSHQFETEEDAQNEAWRRDLTEEHYIISLDDLAGILKNLTYKEDAEDKRIHDAS